MSYNDLVELLGCKKIAYGDTEVDIVRSSSFFPEQVTVNNGKENCVVYRAVRTCKDFVPGSVPSTPEKLQDLVQSHYQKMKEYEKTSGKQDIAVSDAGYGKKVKAVKAIGVFDIDKFMSKL